MRANDTASTAVSTSQPRIITVTGGVAHGEAGAQRWETLGKQLLDLGIIDKVPPVSDYLAAIDE